uniref:Uncharacterized protein n=1 Tax=Sus scrofa TaxID=9823 RepID=A0A8D1ITP4_PIG
MDHSHYHYCWDGTASIGYLVYNRFYVKDHCSKSMGNLHNQKENSKTVNAFDVEDLRDKAVYQGCWRPKSSHSVMDHTQNTKMRRRANTGPLIVKRKETSTDSFDAANQFVMMSPDCSMTITSV